MSFFEEVLNDPKAIEEKILGPSYNYTNNINRLVKNGHIKTDDGYLSVTPIGQPLLNAVLRELLGD